MAKGKEVKNIRRICIYKKARNAQKKIKYNDTQLENLLISFSNNQMFVVENERLPPSR